MAGSQVQFRNYFVSTTFERPHQALGYRTPAEVFNVSPKEEVNPEGMVESLTPDPLRTAETNLKYCLYTVLRMGSTSIL